MPHPTAIVGVVVGLAIVLVIALHPVPDPIGASQVSTRPPRATFSVTLPPVVQTSRPIRSPGPRPSVAPTATSSPGPQPSLSAVAAYDDRYIEIVFDVPDPLGNVLENDDRTRCPSTIGISTTEPSGFPVQVDSGGNVRLITTQPGRWTVPYTITCQTGAYDSSSARVIVELRRSPPTATTVPTLTSDEVATEYARQTATARANGTVIPTRTPDPRATATAVRATATLPRIRTPISTIHVPTRMPVTSVTPRPTIIIRLTPTPAVSPRPTIRPIGTVRPTRPVTVPTATRRP